MIQLGLSGTFPGRWPSRAYRGPYKPSASRGTSDLESGLIGTPRVAPHRCGLKPKRSCLKGSRERALLSRRLEESSDREDDYDVSVQGARRMKYREKSNYADLDVRCIITGNIYRSHGRSRAEWKVQTADDRRQRRKENTESTVRQILEEMRMIAEEMRAMSRSRLRASHFPVEFSLRISWVGTHISGIYLEKDSKGMDNEALARREIEDVEVGLRHDLAHGNMVRNQQAGDCPIKHKCDRSRHPAVMMSSQTGRTHLENQERIYIAASRRGDHSIEARVALARMASKIHKWRTGKGFRITHEIVMNEEMYEEEEDVIPTM
ncbi:hypothetical protein B0H66DRAFT_526680 [Apodospora peruviana]|uniref:Uncharacterized protein n=1 Tax=Apodospora peruviana TaxID=516989 RepID=A0AAE0IQ82_9PEZI|nr:hypothetical protein B0H66DRAFT_526680 [Apodospora peruviana]